ncbi:hypothetical protein ACFLZ5_09800 [Thermodesulfobacteriota bacterium]
MPKTIWDTQAICGQGMVKVGIFQCVSHHFMMTVSRDVRKLRLRRALSKAIEKTKAMARAHCIFHKEELPIEDVKEHIREKELETREFCL